MNVQKEALEQLLTIRSLMEKATTYRTLCAPAALVGGGAALLLGFIQVWLYTGAGSPGFDPLQFAISWLIVLALASVTNILLLFRESKRRGEVAPSPRMRLALDSIVPPLAAIGVLGLAILQITGDPVGCVATWILGYGVALHAAKNFAPPTLRRTGRLCLIAGTLLAGYWALVGSVEGAPVWVAPAAMAAVFGLLHLAYGIRALRAEPSSQGNPSSDSESSSASTATN